MSALAEQLRDDEFNFKLRLIEARMLESIERAHAFDPAGTDPNRYLRTIESHEGNIFDAIDALTPMMPAAFVMYVAGDDERDHGLMRHDALMTVFVASDTLRGNKEARHGSAGFIGTYEMIADIRRLFFGNQLDMNISPLAPAGVEVVRNERMLSIYAVNFNTSFHYQSIEKPFNIPVKTITKTITPTPIVQSFP